MSLDVTVIFWANDSSPPRPLEKMARTPMPILIILEAESFKLRRLTGLTAYISAGLAN